MDGTDYKMPQSSSTMLITEIVDAKYSGVQEVFVPPEN